MDLLRVRVGKSLNFSELSFSPVKNGDNGGSHLQGLESACKMRAPSWHIIPFQSMLPVNPLPGHPEWISGVVRCAE